MSHPDNFAGEPGREAPASGRRMIGDVTDRHLIDVHLLLLDGEQVLLSRRRDRNPRFDDVWHLPSGKLDAGESVLHAAARESREELGVEIDEPDLRHVHTLHINGSGVEPRLGLFFAVRRWRGEPVNREPDKCSGLAWFAAADLPPDIIEYSKLGIESFLRGNVFDVHGWPGQTDWANLNTPSGS